MRSITKEIDRMIELRKMMRGAITIIHKSIRIIAKDSKVLDDLILANDLSLEKYGNSSPLDVFKDATKCLYDGASTATDIAKQYECALKCLKNEMRIYLENNTPWEQVLSDYLELDCTQFSDEVINAYKKVARTVEKRYSKEESSKFDTNCIKVFSKQLLTFGCSVIDSNIEIEQISSDTQKRFYIKLEILFHFMNFYGTLELNNFDSDTKNFYDPEYHFYNLASGFSKEDWKLIDPDVSNDREPYWVTDKKRSESKE